MSRFNLQFRAASSTAEVIIAIALLAIAASLVGRFVSQVRSGLSDRELGARIGWELQNARERIGSWSTDEITAERIGQMQVSKGIAGRIENARLNASVKRIESPVVATQVTLGLQGELKGQTIQPTVLTFWVPVKNGEEP